MSIVALWLLAKFNAPWWVWVLFAIELIVDIDHKTK